ncbi:MAG: 3-oxoacyl-[acyl-carrier-protein] reductase [Bryobacterales bacterium]|nr:3-oxoacyl-[acyl-carrier-protein] reductase [Bryobacterales bacterium]MBV9400376.1 3-oxoacyl-[acyl-carrier-protein] reductase [Bryobacterales bacterium]
MINRTAFVTGASRGIGLACAQALAAAGCRVVLAARDTAKLEEASAAIPGSSWVRIDLASSDSIEDAFRNAGKVDILVNNAGITRDGLAMRMKKEAWEEVLATNLTGSFLAIQKVLPGMVKERWGRIINVSSIVGQAGNPGQANYVASKAGLIGLTKSLAQELGSRNITVNAVAPGFIETDMTGSLPQELKDSMLGRIPLKRFGKAEEVAAAVRFLASEEAAYISGHVLNVSGGMYM